MVSPVVQCALDYTYPPVAERKSPPDRGPRATSPPASLNTLRLVPGQECGEPSHPPHFC